MQAARLIVISIALLVLPSTLTAQSSSIREGIIAAIEADPGFGPHELSIEASRGGVVLEGTVASIADRELVERAAWRQPGVSRVENRLGVRPALAAPSVHRAALAAAVKEAISRAPDVHGYAVTISADDGAVVLMGEAETERDLRAITRAAQGVAGVVTVDNQMRVRPGPSDAEIERRLKQVLEADPAVNLSSVEVQVHDGVAFVSGRTKNHRETDRILSIALMVPGVRDIRSDVQESVNN